MPECRSGGRHTVAVTGATTSIEPEPEHDDRGQHAREYASPGSMRDINSIPSAITIGPTVSGIRGPMRWASAPDRADSSEHQHRDRQRGGTGSIGE